MGPFERIDVRVVETLRDALIFFDRRSRYVRKKARLRKIEARQYVVDDFVDARILQANRIQHPVGRFANAMRRIAEAHVACRTLEDHGADVLVGEAYDTRVFLAETNATG